MEGNDIGAANVEAAGKKALFLVQVDRLGQQKGHTECEKDKDAGELHFGWKVKRVKGSQRILTVRGGEAYEHDGDVNISPTVSYNLAFHQGQFLTIYPEEQLYF